MSFHLDICVTTNLLQQRPTASIHSYMNNISCLSFWVHAWYQFVISLLQIWYSNHFFVVFVSRPCFIQNVISFRDTCVTTQLLQQRPTASVTFICESHIHVYVCLSECMLYTHWLYHSSMIDAHSCHLYIFMFIYLPIDLRPCFTTTILKGRCAPLPDAVIKTPRS
jgi:hypothetical protein